MVGYDIRKGSQKGLMFFSKDNIPIGFRRRQAH